jgi:hypothetical protein
MMMSREFATVVLSTLEPIEAAKTPNKNNNNPDSDAYDDTNADQLNAIGEDDFQGHNLLAVYSPCRSRTPIRTENKPNTQ